MSHEIGSFDDKITQPCYLLMCLDTKSQNLSFFLFPFRMMMKSEFLHMRSLNLAMVPFLSE